MSKITRYAGNLRAFGSEAQGVERTLFGETTQADDLTSQITAAFLRGWGVVVKWFTEFGHLNRGDMLTSEQHRCHNEKKKFQRRV